MALLSILDRFRPAGAPGPAAVGVPAVDRQGPAGELAPVFAALADDVTSCEQLVAEARTAAESTVAAVREQASALLAQARLDAGVERARAAAQVQRDAADRDTEAQQEAVSRAAELAALGAARIPVLVHEVVADLLAGQSTQ